MEMKEISFADFRCYLEVDLPESRPLLEEVEQREEDEARDMGIILDAARVGTYGIMSDVFWWGVFQPALEHGDTKLLRKCYAVVEELIQNGDQNLLTCLQIRVVPYLESVEWMSTSLEHGGPGLRSMIEKGEE